MSNSRQNEQRKPISQRLNNIKIRNIRRSAEALLRSDFISSISDGDRIYSDDVLAPVMPAIDAVQLLIEEENKSKPKLSQLSDTCLRPSTSRTTNDELKKLKMADSNKESKNRSTKIDISKTVRRQSVGSKEDDESFPPNETKHDKPDQPTNKSSLSQPTPKEDEDNEPSRVQSLSSLLQTSSSPRSQDSYEFIPKSVTLDVYSNDPEVKRFLKQLHRIANEFGYNEQDYKCFICQRPIGMVFGESRLCHFDGHHYCNDCHLGEKSIIPARVLCNWDFNTYPISKRNQHFLKLISNEAMFEIKIVAPLLYEACAELCDIRELRSQALSIRSYCFTCVQDSISFELNKLVWPREHLIKNIDLYSLQDLIQVKSGQLKQVLKTVIQFGTQHVLSCVLCRQKGFICEICKSSQIIYPFETESVHRCNGCQSIYHKNCFNLIHSNSCPRCQRLRARQNVSVIS